MYTLRVRDVKAAVANACNLCDTATDLPRILDYLNRAMERLLYEGKWKGTVQTFRICLDASGCITWPREIETIEALGVCHSPTPIRTQWYEFNENGPGIIDDQDACLCNTMLDRGEAPAFDDVVGSNKKLAVFCDRTEETGKYINLQFYDQFGQWVRTAFDGEVIDGENIPLPSPGLYNYTTAVCRPGGLVAVKKDLTVGVVRLYEYNTTDGALKPLAYYQPDEEVPVYRRSLIPGLANDSCEQQRVTVRAKLRFIPARTAESFVMISHREAIRLACKAVYLEECDRVQEATTDWAVALRLLDKQLQHHEGSGARPVPQFSKSCVWGGGFQAVQ